MIPLAEGRARRPPERGLRAAGPCAHRGRRRHPAPLKPLARLRAQGRSASRARGGTSPTGSPSGERLRARDRAGSYIGETESQQPCQRLPFRRTPMGAARECGRIPDILIGGRDVEVPAQTERAHSGGLGRECVRQRSEPGELVGEMRIVERPAVGHVRRPHAQARQVAAIAREPGSGKPGSRRNPRSTSSMPTRDTVATPFHWASPCAATSYPLECSSSRGNAAFAILVSCRQTTSGWTRSSQSSSRGRRARCEFTFQVASRIRTGCPMPVTSPPAGRQALVVASVLLLCHGRTAHGSTSPAFLWPPGRLHVLRRACERMKEPRAEAILRNSSRLAGVTARGSDSSASTICSTALRRAGDVE
jgi:hypothetical protein